MIRMHTALTSALLLAGPLGAAAAPAHVLKPEELDTEAKSGEYREGGRGLHHARHRAARLHRGGEEEQEEHATGAGGQRFSRSMLVPDLERDGPAHSLASDLRVLLSYSA